MTGFTLIEVSIAAAVIMVSLAGLTKGAVEYNRAMQHQARVTQAIGCLETITEELLATLGGDPRLNPGTHSDQFDRNGLRVSSGGYYLVNWTVTNDVPFAGQRSIKLGVKWQEPSGSRGFSWTVNRP